jgi:acyl-CoA synthetase (NDP forming)
MDEARYTIAALLNLKALPRGTKVAILGGAGGGSVTMTDLAEREGLKVPHLAEETVRGIETFVPIEGHSARNPLDIDIDRPEDFFKLMELLRDDPNVEVFMYNLHFRWIYRERGRAGVNELIQQAIKARELIGKPVLVIVEREGNMEMDAMAAEATQGFQEAGLPTFDSFEIAARVLFKLNQYREFKDFSQRAGGY